MTLAAVDHEKALAELDQLMAETYQLWNEEWVGFSWRNYTYDHVSRVRALARTLGRREKADDLVIRYGATLHDITKSFDGEILTDPDGKRVVDENGLWLNDYLPPARANKLTRLYDRLDLHRTVHSKSGAIVANTLLDEYGLPPEFRDHVGEVIHTHLMPGPESSVEGKCLYDADTVDANIGLPAFYRNIRISMHRQEDQFAAKGDDLDAWLDANRDQFLREYLGERVPAWNEGKRRDFVSKLTMPSSQKVAGTRVDRLGVLLEEMKRELDDPEAALEDGMLAVVWRFIKNRRNPSLTKELVHLELEHCHGEPKSAAARLIVDIRKEVAGER
ncbi:MAG TPA: HD domain-containing protein [Chloroflexota bacterium]